MLLPRGSPRPDGAGFRRAVDLENRAPEGPRTLAQANALNRDVAERTPAIAGILTFIATQASMCIGTVTSHRGAVISARIKAMSAGSNGERESIAHPLCSGSITVASRPHMCCAGTVPSIAPPGESDRRSRSARAPEASAPQVFECGRGAPVEPDVNNVIAGCRASIAGISLLVARGHSRRSTCVTPPAVPGRSTKQ
jgi:hypothetical protein